MELRQLAYVVAVADEGSFTRAAAREHVAQPGVSAQVRRLERELGQALFHRGPGPVTPTAAGEAVLPFARAALAAAAGVRDAADEIAGLVRGRVALGVVPSVSGRLAGALAGFRTDDPGVEITLVEGTSDALLDAGCPRRRDHARGGHAGRAARRRPRRPPRRCGGGRGRCRAERARDRDGRRRAPRRRRASGSPARRAAQRHGPAAAGRAAHRAAARDRRGGGAPARPPPRGGPAPGGGGGGGGPRAGGGRPPPPPRRGAAR